MKKVTVRILGEIFEIGMEEDFYEFVKDDIELLQTATTKDILRLILSKEKELFTFNSDLKALLEKLEGV
jgi:hypothetical protein